MPFFSSLADFFFRPKNDAAPAEFFFFEVITASAVFSLLFPVPLPFCSSAFCALPAFTALFTSLLLTALFFAASVLTPPFFSVVSLTVCSLHCFLLLCVSGPLLLFCSAFFHYVIYSTARFSLECGRFSAPFVCGLFARFFRPFPIRLLCFHLRQFCRKPSFRGRCF